MARNNQSGEVKTGKRPPGILKAGAHRVWEGVGAAGGAVAGAAIGAVAGPFGAALGLMACAVAGGLAGRGVADKMEPTVEETYDHYPNRRPGENNISYAYRARAESRSDSSTRERDRSKKYLEVESGFAARLREAQTFQSNLG